jgi:hypothetical protein
MTSCVWDSLTARVGRSCNISEKIDTTEFYMNKIIKVSPELDGRKLEKSVNGENLDLQC